MTNTTAALDTNLDAALVRLFDLLKIKSISTDPAFNGDCAAAAQWLCDDLTEIGLMHRCAQLLAIPWLCRMQKPCAQMRRMCCSTAFTVFEEVIVKAATKGKRCRRG